MSGSTYTVTGTYSYAAHGTYAPEVDISSVAGSTASATDSVTVADAVTTCTGDGCSGTVTTPTQTVQVNSSSSSGTIDTNVDPGDTGPDCGPNDQFRHAPEVTTFDAVGVDANIVFTVSFDNASAAGSWFVPFEVCYPVTDSLHGLLRQHQRDDWSPAAVREPRRGPMRPVHRRVARPSGQSHRRRHRRRNDRGATGTTLPSSTRRPHGQRALTTLPRRPAEGRHRDFRFRKVHRVLPRPIL